MGYVFNAVEDGGVPLKMIKEIVKGFDVPYFVETGTAGAHSILKASEVFEKCHTIELIEGRTPSHKERIVYDENDPTIADHVFDEIKYPENITFHVGDSTQILPKINKSIGDNYAVYWLDAHYSDPEPSPEDCIECPIVSELEAISENNKAIILIDDARLFLGTPPPPLKPSHWVGIQSLFIWVEHFFTNHHITIIDDYVVAVPREMKDNLNSYWLETYKERYK